MLKTICILFSIFILSCTTSNPKSVPNIPKQEVRLQTQKPEKVAKAEISNPENKSEPVTSEFTFRDNPNYFYSKDYPSNISEQEQLFAAKLLATITLETTSKPKLDTNLSFAARTLCRYHSTHKQKATEELKELVRIHYGLAHTDFHYIFSDNQNEAIDQYWDINTATSPNHIGIGIFKSDDSNSQDNICIAYSNKHIILEPIPKQVTSEHRFAVKGNCHIEKSNLYMNLYFFNEKVFSKRLKVKNGNFFSEMQIPSAPANYRFEISNIQKNEVTRLISVTIFNKIRQIQKYPNTNQEIACLKDTGCEQRLEEMINTQRDRLSRAPLSSNTSLVKIARHHADDMVQKHYSSEYDRNGKNIAQRLIDENINNLQSGEIVAGGYTIKEIFANLMKKHNFRIYLKNPHLTNIGCGISSKRQDDTVYSAVSCVFVTMLDNRKGKVLTKAIYNKLNQMRIKQGKIPFGNEPLLQETADTALERLIDNPKQAKAVQEDVKLEMETGDLKIKNSIFGVFTIFTLDQLQHNKTVLGLLNSNFDKLVISVIKKDDPNTSTSGIFVYYISYR